MSRLRTGSDDGFSIVELIVSITLTSLVLTLVGSFFVTVSKASSAAQTSRSATGTASNAMDEIREVLREGCQIAKADGTSSPAVVIGTSSTLTVTALIDTSATTPAPTQVSLGLNPSNYLAETRTPGVFAGSVWTFSGTPSTRIVAGPLTATAISFAYYDANQGALAPGASGLSASQRAAVAFIDVTVTVPNTTYGMSNPVVLRNMIGVPGFSVTGT